jgi:hypothetical protein
VQSPSGLEKAGQLVFGYNAVNENSSGHEKRRMPKLAGQQRLGS